MGEEFFDAQYRLFLVGERPFCVWDSDINKTTLEFLDQIDTDYFTYIADTLIEPAIDDNSQYAALIIRATYSQGLEMLFAMIAASIQAPRCVPAWMVLYQNNELCEIVRRINSGLQFPSLLQQKKLSWRKVADFLHSWLKLEDTEKEKAIKQGLATLWAKFAHDFLDNGFSGEYNSIKHGLRIKPGGFWMSIGVEDEPGVRASKERMKLVGQSGFGSRFFLPEKMANTSHHIRLRRHHRNWNPEDFAWGLHLISISISNVIAALKTLNGVPAKEIRFQWPSDLDTFSKPWKRTMNMGVTSMTGFQILVPDELIEPFPKDVIKSRYEKGDDAGVRRILISPSADGEAVPNDNPDEESQG